MFVRLFVGFIVCSFVRSFVLVFVRLFVGLIVCSFVRSFLCLSVCLLVSLFVRLLHKVNPHVCASSLLPIY